MGETVSRHSNVTTQPLQRVFVFGGPCSGKSTFADGLGDILGLPVVHLDDIFWGPNWEQSDRDEFRKKVEKLAEQDAWIVEGAYNVVRSFLLERSTLTVFLDMPLPVVFWRLVSRTIRRNSPFALGQVPPLPKAVEEKGGREPIVGTIRTLWRFARRFERERRLPFIEEAESVRGAEGFRVLSTRADVRAFLNGAKGTG